MAATMVRAFLSLSQGYLPRLLLKYCFLVSFRDENSKLPSQKILKRLLIKTFFFKEIKALYLRNPLILYIQGKTESLNANTLFI